MISTKSAHLIAPDLLRAVAILMVFFYHLCGPLCGWWQDFTRFPSARYTFFPVSFGWAGVALFFVLSGFCIHYSFLKSNGLTWRKFFWLRLWRIYPAYIVALVFFTFLQKTDLHRLWGIKQFGMHALLLHNISADYFFGIDPAFWSLAVEVQLYLLFPVLMLLRQRWGIEGCLIATAVVALASRLLVCILWGLPDHLGSPAFSSPFTTWFDWTLGAFVAERFSQERRAFTKHSVWLLILVPLFLMSTIYTQSAALISFSVAAAVSAVVLDLMVKVNWRKSRLLSIGTFIGTISYSLYLWHQPLLFRLSYHFRGLPFFPRWIAVVIIIFALSALSWALIERNGIRLGHILWRKWFHVQTADELASNRPFSATPAA